MNETRTVVQRETNASDRAPRILIVEDESSLALLLVYNMEAEGFIVEHVDRGDEAELRIAESPPDLVILDWMLPGVSGLESCRRLRGRDGSGATPGASAAQTSSAPATSTLIARRGASKGRGARFTWGRRSFACWNISWRSRAASSRGRSFSTASGACRRRSTSA